MNVGIDIDGTLTKYPNIFTKLGEALINSGHTVYIVTGLGKEKAEEKVGRYNSSQYFSSILSSDGYNEAERRMVQAGIENELIVAVFKRRMYAEFNIELVFDDKADLINNLYNKSNTGPLILKV